MTRCQLCWFSLLLLFITGCSPDYSQERYPLELLDTLGLLAPETRAKLEAASYPEGFAFVIETQQTDGPVAWVGAQAEAAFGAAASRHAQPAAFAERGVYILLTAEPSLVQVRTGAELVLLAQWRGVTAGPEYLHWQKIALGGSPDSALLGMTHHLIHRLPAVTDLQGLRKWIYAEGMMFLGSELENLSLPSQSFYSQSMLRPVVHLFARLQSWGLGWWAGYLLVFSGAWLVGALLNRWVLGHLVRNYPKMRSVAAQVLQVVLALLVGVPSIAGVLLLSGNRMEDQLGLEALGIEGIGAGPSLNPEAWAGTPWWLALLVAILFLLARLAGNLFPLLQQAGLSDLEQRQQYYALRTQDLLGLVAMEFSITLGMRESEADAAQKAQAPFTFLLVRLLWVSALFTPLMGVFCGLFLPRAMAVALFWFLVLALVRSLAGAIAQGIGAMRQEMAQENFDEEKVNGLLKQVGDYAQQGHTDEVYDLLVQVKALTGNIQPIAFYVDSYREIGDYAFAARLMQLRLEDAPWNREWVSELAALYQQAGEVELEVEQLACLYELHEQVEPNPEIASVLQRWGKLLLSLRQYGEAAERYQALYALTGKPAFRAQAALALVGDRAFAPAKAEAEAALAEDDQLAVAWLVMGEIYAEQEANVPAACDAFIRARELGLALPEIEAYLAKHQGEGKPASDRSPST